MSVKLDIYIDPACPGCDTAINIARTVKEHMPQISVNLIDLTRSESHRPDAVFAVPTYLLNGKTMSLGNPDEAMLLSRLREALDHL
ncbi:MAG: hypothetical protein GTO14_11820 [Anaerolineales bacterium]|nr:hypothetical protein [Anaerolineales bacterium]